MKYKCSEGICNINCDTMRLYCQKMDRKTGIFEAPYQFIPNWYCPYAKKYVDWIEYNLESIMKDIIKEHEEEKNALSLASFSKSTK